jgi:hypothetical protein
MPEEDNPFLVKPRKKEEKKEEQFGSDELVSFMITPEEGEKLKHRNDKVAYEKPHWEDAGTPIWEKEFSSTKAEKDEVVDHESEQD